jgi:hypothetical protein
MNSITSFISGALFIGVLSAIVAIAVPEIREHFVNVPIRALPSRETEIEAIPSNYQASLPPRNAPVSYNALIRQRLGSVRPEKGADFMAEPAVPLDNIVELPAESAESAESVESYMSPQQQVKYMDSVDVPLGRAPVDVYDKVRAAKQDRQVVFDRLVYSLGKSRLHGAGDPIRGDLPIVPTLPVADPNSPIWFVPAASIDRDLRQGALQAIAGDNEASRNLQRLKSSANPAYRAYHITPDGTIVQQKHSQLSGQGMSDLSIESNYSVRSFY